MSDANEREELELLVASPGWLRLMEYARVTWTVGYPRRIKQAIRDAMEANQNVSEAVQRVDAANDEVNAVLSYPKDRIAALLSHEASRKQSESLSRRGGL